MELLTFMGLQPHADELAGNLSYGDQRRLEIARAMATDPTLICLDEPAAGFNPAEKAQLMDLIRKVRDHGHTVLLIEHDMRWRISVKVDAPSSNSRTTSNAQRSPNTSRARATA